MTTDLQLQLKVAPKSIYLHASSNGQTLSQKDREESEKMVTKLVVQNLSGPVLVRIDNLEDQKKSTVFLGMYLETGHGMYGLDYAIPLVFQFQLNKIAHLTSGQLKKFLSSEIKQNTTTTKNIMHCLEENLLSINKPSSVH